MVKVFLLPGDIVCNAIGLPRTGDHRQILRSFVNTVVWGAVGLWVALKFAA